MRRLSLIRRFPWSSTAFSVLTLAAIPLIVNFVGGLIPIWLRILAVLALVLLLAVAVPLDLHRQRATTVPLRQTYDTSPHTDADFEQFTEVISVKNGG
jgi:hypothetical protein